MAPVLPTYQSAAAVLEQKNGSGVRLAGWTVARGALIAVSLLAVGVKPARAVAGAAVATTLITTLAVCALSEARRVV